MLLIIKCQRSDWLTCLHNYILLFKCCHLASNYFKLQLGNDHLLLSHYHLHEKHHFTEGVNNMWPQTCSRWILFLVVGINESHNNVNYKDSWPAMNFIIIFCCPSKKKCNPWLLTGIFYVSQIYLNHPGTKDSATARTLQQP